MATAGRCDDGVLVDAGVRELVDRLPDRLRKAALLHYYADLPVKEVARLLHRPEGTIRQRLHQARRILAEDIKRETNQR